MTKRTVEETLRQLDRVDASRVYTDRRVPLVAALESLIAMFPAPAKPAKGKKAAAG